MRASFRRLTARESTERFGFVGVGAISGVCLENLTKRFNNEPGIIGVCDLIR